MKIQRQLPSAHFPALTNEEGEFVPQAKILRVLTLILTLYGHRLSVRSIAEMLDVTERTAYRYLSLIETAGIPVDSVGSHFFIAQDDCPFCHGVIKKEVENFAAPISHPEFEMLGHYYRHITNATA